MDIAGQEDYLVLVLWEPDYPNPAETDLSLSCGTEGEVRHTNISLSRICRQHNPIPPIPLRLLKTPPLLRSRNSLFVLVRRQSKRREADTRTRR